MKLKKKFKFSDSNQVWRIKITDTDKLFVETRDTEKMEAFFHSYDLLTGKRIFSGHQMSEKYWLGIESIVGDIVFFHRYTKPDMPGHRGIIAFDITTQQTLWEDDSLSYLFVKGNLIYVYQERFEGRAFFTLDINTGKVVEELGNNPDDINELQDVAERSIDYSNYIFPEKYFAENSNSTGVSIIEKETKDIDVTGDIEFIESNNLLIFNYHETGGNKTLTNKIKAFDLSKGKELLNDILNKSANAFAPDSFFIYKNAIILLKEKTEVIVFQIKD
jgi:hypothetical protein